MPAISTLKPGIQNITWDRIATLPTVANLNLTIVEDQPVLFVQYSIQFENTSVNWLFSPGNETSSFLFFDGNSAALPLQVKNLESLPNGVYEAYVYIELSNGDGFIRTLSSMVQLTLSGVSPGQITTDKTNYNVLYNRETNTLSGDTHVEIINNTALDPLTFETIGTLFNELTATEEFDLVEDPAFPFLTNAELPVSGSVTVSCKLRKAGVFVYGFTVTVTVINDDDILVSPESLSFQLRKGFNETKSATLTLTNPLNKAFTITKPAWLNLSADAGSASAAITVTTENSDTFTVGDFTGNIVISYDTKTITIPVALTVIAFIDINTEEHNFCLDDVILKVFRMSEAARFVRVTMQMKFTTAAGETETESVYQVPYFKDKVRTDVGVKIQSFFPVFQNHLFDATERSFDNRLIYKAAEVVLKVEELDINYNVLLSNILPAADFYAGHRPLQFPLFTNFPVRRKYSGSTFFFSYLADQVSAEDFTSGVDAGNPAGDKEVHAVMLPDGGILDATLIKNNLGVDLLPFPNVESQAVLQWLNENLVPEWMILSGNYKIDDAFDHIADSFQLGAQKYGTSETQKLTISTGFILKEETYLVKEIIKSKLAFIRLEGKIYRILPSSQKLTELERQKNLINYELEFIIVLWK